LTPIRAIARAHTTQIVAVDAVAVGAPTIGPGATPPSASLRTFQRPKSMRIVAPT